MHKCRHNICETLKQIGTIPEFLAHDSTEEKLFSKASDAVLSRAFREIGLKSTVLKERGDSADVLAKSPIHGYTLVADAKAFRMSRTAKNQKDFKVVALSGWRKDSEYAVLCSPYFQYPSKNSQIYSQAISHNVCLLSWEHLIFLIENGVKETSDISFSSLWAFCDTYSNKVLCSDMKKCFIPQFNAALLELTGLSDKLLLNQLKKQIVTISERGNQEKLFWQEEIQKIQCYSREEAISELIKAKKIHEKIAQIDTYIKGLQI
ncbi:MAG: HindIII family type II restriction endonuclease [Lachnospiraceae bacterium]|nr:HindIII family type II restriction endonuclease [Lachnospiraceae bacterium]